MLLQRERLHDRLARAATFPVAVVVAPEGFGKSAAIARLHRESGETTHLYQVTAAHTSLTRFVRGLAAALEPTLPSLSQSLAIAHERATQSSGPSGVLAGWLAQHLGSAPRTIIIDDFHLCERETAIASFLSAAVDRTRRNVRWVIATRAIAELPYATWFARGDTDLPVDESAFRLSEAEARSMAAQTAPSADDELVIRLLAATNGSIGKFAFAVATAAADPGLADRVLEAGGDAFERFADAALDALEPCERQLLADSVYFPDLESELFAAAGYDDAPRLLAALQAKIALGFARRDGTTRYSPLFGDVLARRVAAAGPDAVRDANVRTAQALERAGRPTEALAYYIRGRAFDALAKAIEAHGFAFVEAGFGETVGEAIDALDAMVQMSSPIILAIKAMFESRLSRFDTAESYFQLSIDRTVDPAVRDRIVYEYCTHLLRFIRPEAMELLERLAGKPDTSDEIRCYALAALGPAYIFARRFDEASETTGRALSLLETGSKPHLRARAHHQAAYVALFRGDGARAKELASISLTLANEHGFFDVAAGALTVLYNVAADVDDNIGESLRLLEAVADCAAKSGSLTTHIFALIARLEVEVERGDEDAIADLDEKLRAIDITCSGRAAYEALLPSQALRSTWNGDFGGAYRLLASSASQQWSADRKALRWAEIAVYAAAANLSVEAGAAYRKAVDLLEGVEPDLRVSRTRLLLALAMILLGRGDSARELFELIATASGALSPRLNALRRALAALAERYRGVVNAGTMLHALNDLREHHFGGIARMLMSLPLAENASLRLGELSAADRLVLRELVAGNILVDERRVERVVIKLGCTNVGAALRAVGRYSPTLEFPTSNAPSLKVVRT